MNFTILEKNEKENYMLIKVKSDLYKDYDFPVVNITLSNYKKSNLNDAVNEIALHNIKTILEQEKTEKKEKYIDFNFKNFDKNKSEKIIDKNIDIGLNFIN